MIISGYYERPGERWAQFFHKLWFDTLMRFAKPDRTVIISSADQVVRQPRGEWIVMGGDLGNCDAVLYGRKPYFMPACPAVWMAGAWLAYLNGTDMIALEQDALAFGPWVAKLYAELGDRQAIFGHTRMHGVSTSLFLVRHKFLPQFVRDYLSEGPETHINRIAEAKVLRMVTRWPELYGQYSFGYCKDRPFNPHDEVFFAQKFTRNELLWLESLGLISCEGIPDGVELFSNNV